MWADFDVANKPLTKTTKAADVKKRVYDFFRDTNLSWDLVSANCTDGAPVMPRRKYGFGVLVKGDASWLHFAFCKRMRWQQNTFNT